MANKGKGHFGEKTRHMLQGRGIKTKKYNHNLTANGNHGWKKDFTEHELLWDKITPDRLKELINNKDYEVTEISHSTNSFGEFQFITLHKKSTNEFVTFYGNGYHWVRDRYITNYFQFYSNPGAGSDFYNAKSIGRGQDEHTLYKPGVIEELDNVRVLLERKAKKHKREPTQKTDQFEMIADELGDENFAYSETYM